MGLFSKLLSDEPDEDSLEEKAYSNRAMHIVMREVGILNGVFGDVSAAQTAAVRTKIAKKREWADGLEEPKWRKALNGWLDHAEYCCDRADRYRNERPESDRRIREMNAEFREVSARAGKLGQPR